MESLDFTRDWTLKQPVLAEGLGLHTGAAVAMEIRPRQEPGLFFHVPGPLGSVTIPARADFVSSTARSTQLARQGASVATVEHVLSALYGLGVSAADIWLSGPECPIFDGSAGPLCEKIVRAGRRELRSPRPILRLLRPIALQDGPATILCLPAGQLGISYAIAFDGPTPLHQCLAFQFSPARYLAEIAPARTFGFEHEIQRLQAQGLIRGGTLANALVIGAAGYLNPPRLQQECVRHKILDLLGDLCLSGQYIQGYFMAFRAGHGSHVKIVKKLTQADHGKQ